MLRRPADLTANELPIAQRRIGSLADVEPLLELCSKGKLYEVEDWIARGKPVQFPPPEDRKLQRRSTALQIAVERGFHSLAALLLANGYNPNGDYYECLSPAVRAKDHDMVDLLIRFGADASAVDFREVLETCDRRLMDRFIAAGVDPCKGNAIARALSFKGRPILGFIKQYRDAYPGIQRQIDIALHEFTEADDVRGVALMLWLGADPHAPTPSSAYERDDADVNNQTAFEAALYKKPEILSMLSKRPIPDGRVAELFQTAAYRHSPGLVRRLLAQGADPNSVSEDGYHVLHGFMFPLLSRFGRNAEETEEAFQALEIVLKAGARWTMSDRQVKGLRRDLADGESRIVIRLLELLKQYEAFPPEQFSELTRTPAVKRVLNGITKPRRDYWGPGYAPAPVTPVIPATPPGTRGYWKRHWSQR